MLDSKSENLSTNTSDNKPQKLEWGRSEWASYTLKNWKSLIPAIPVIKEIVESSKKGERRSLANDLVRASEGFNTNTVFEGQEHIPEVGGMIIAFSHVAAVKEFPGWGKGRDNILWWASGMAQVLKAWRGPLADFRPVALAPAGPGSKEWRKVLKIYGGFPIDLNDPKLSLRSIKEAGESARNGDVVIISPEGETYTGVTNPKRGLAKIASAGIPILPVGFLQESQSNGYIYKVRFGEPVIPQSEDLKTKKGEFQLVDKVMQSIAHLLPEEMRGVYAKTS